MVTTRQKLGTVVAVLCALACGTTTRSGAPYRGIYRGTLRLDSRTTCAANACVPAASLSLVVEEDDQGFSVAVSGGQSYRAIARDDVLLWTHDRPVHQIRCEGTVHGIAELAPARGSGTASLQLVATPSCDGSGAAACTCAYKGTVDRF